jgi:hypothetical protein
MLESVQQEIRRSPKTAILTRYWLEIILFILTAAILAWKHSFIFDRSFGGVLTASVAFMVLSFALTSFFLNRQGVGFERLFFGLISMVSGIWLFELLYHFGYPGTINTSAIVAGLSTMNFNTDNGQTFPLLWSLIMIVLPFCGLRYMTISKSLLAIAALSVGFWAVWIWSGYPQWIAPQWWPAQKPLINLMPLALAHTENSLIVYWGYVWNSLCKVVEILPALLFNKKIGTRLFRWSRSA